MEDFLLFWEFLILLNFGTVVRQQSRSIFSSNFRVFSSATGVRRNKYQPIPSAREFQGQAES